MLQKQNYEFSTSDSFQLCSTIVSIILIAESYVSICNRSDSAVADSSAVSIAGKIDNSIAISIECLFDKWFIRVINGNKIL
ncbi:MAG: hypothetical protein RR964_00015 [Lachnospiraceae bacterium]